jgi:hypothetical protein
MHTEATRSDAIFKHICMLILVKVLSSAIVKQIRLLVK